MLRPGIMRPIRRPDDIGIDEEEYDESDGWEEQSKCIVPHGYTTTASTL